MTEQVAGAVRDGDRIVMLEDVVTSGGMTLKAIEALEREFNVEIIKIIALVDRLQGAAETIEGEGFDFVPLFTVEDLNINA